LKATVRALLYFDGGAGRCCATLFSPQAPPAVSAGESAPTACLFVPPFGEEMNKSRRMAALLGRSLAAAGSPMLLPDLWGTGDSGGDFADARWDTWCADLRAAVDLLADLSACSVAVVALRLGALLALDVLRDLALPVTRLVLWQPVISGSQFLTQFLRLRVASALVEGGGATVRAVREELENSGSVEIGGYELALALARSIDTARLDAVRPEITTPVHWLDVASDPERPLAPPVQQVIDDWRHAGVPVEVARIRGDAFWATQEITEVPDLIAATTRLLTMTAP
jgi:exosortase A-associated hydrolase 2